MTNKTMKSKDVSVSFHDNEVKFEGRLSMPYLQDYKDVKEFLWDIASKAKAGDHIKINIENIDMMNSSGQAIINMFILEYKKKVNHQSNIEIYGSSAYEWHRKFIDIFSKLCKGRIRSFIDNEEVVSSTIFDGFSGWALKK